MKLKLTPDASAVVTKIAHLTDITDVQQILSVLNEFDKQIRADKETGLKTLSQKRRELSFFYSLFRGTEQSAKVAEANRCSLLLKIFKDIYTQEALKSEDFIKLVLPYGILRLSAVEIKQLVAMNRKRHL